MTSSPLRSFMPADAACRAPIGARLLLVETDRLARVDDQEKIVSTGRERTPDELVVVAQLDRDDPVRLERRVVRP